MGKVTVPGSLAVITGAGSGIGRATAKAFAVGRGQGRRRRHQRARGEGDRRAARRRPPRVRRRRERRRRRGRARRPHRARARGARHRREQRGHRDVRPLPRHHPGRLGRHPRREPARRHQRLRGVRPGDGGAGQRPDGQHLLGPRLHPGRRHARLLHDQGRRPAPVALPAGRLGPPRRGRLGDLPRCDQHPDRVEHPLPRCQRGQDQGAGPEGVQPLAPARDGGQGHRERRAPQPVHRARRRRVVGRLVPRPATCPPACSTSSARSCRGWPPAGPVAEPRQRRVAGAGIDLAVREWGDPSQPTVVLVHGFPDTGAVWIPVAEALVDHGLQAVDLRRPRRGCVRFARRARGLRARSAGRRPARGRRRRVAGPPRAPRGPRLGLDPGLGGGDVGRARRAAGLVHLDLGSAARPRRPLDARPARHRDIVTLLRQGVRSSYVAAFHTPGVARHGLALPAGHRPLARRVERARWPAWTAPAPTTRGRRRPSAPTSPGAWACTAPTSDRSCATRSPATPTCPCSSSSPLQDRFVPAWLFEGIEAVAPDLRRREVQARHWLVRSQPVDVASWIASFVEEIEARPATGAAEAPQEAAG